MSKLVIVAVLAASGVAHAGDSSWLLCKGLADRGSKPSVERSHFAASLLEHRGVDGASRDLDVTLVYGAHVSHGTIQNIDTDGAKPAALVVNSIAGKQPVTFSGTAQLAQDLSTFTVTGKIDFAFGADAKPTLLPFVAKLSCERLDDLAIGH